MIVATGRTVNGLGIETQDEDDENSAGAIIADLVSQGADLHATAPDTGETPLHLAARFVFFGFELRILKTGIFISIISHEYLLADFRERMRLRNY